MGFSSWFSFKKKEYHYFRLYIAGQSPNSLKALGNLKKICKLYFTDYKIEVIDLLKEPLRAKDDDIIAIPTLVKLSPAPTFHLVGTLSNMDVVRKHLNIE